MAFIEEGEIETCQQVRVPASLPPNERITLAVGVRHIDTCSKS